MLKKAGHLVTVALSPAIALEIIESGARPDLLLTDVIMPKMNGHQLSERVKEHIPTIEVVFMSGYSGEIITRQGTLPRNIRLVEKPFNASVLSAAIAAALSAHE